MSQNQPTSKNNGNPYIGCFLILSLPTLTIILSIISTTIMSLTHDSGIGLKVFWIEWYRYFTGTQQDLDTFWFFNVIAIIVAIILSIAINATILEEDRWKGHHPPKQ